MLFRSLSKCSHSSAPGLDTIPYFVWKSHHRRPSAILTSPLGPLLQYLHHPSSLKKANGIVFDKPLKPSYDSPDSFRIIVLFQTVSKILARIVASQLSVIARHVGLLHPNQCGSLPSLSSFDACIFLVDTVRTLECPALEVSSLFLDIKGGFDNVNADILCSSLCSKGVNHYLVSWVRSFLTGRSCRLFFKVLLEFFLRLQWVPHKVHLSLHCCLLFMWLCCIFPLIEVLYPSMLLIYPLLFLPPHIAPTGGPSS